MTYLIIPGAQKSASTSLFRLIERHPSVCSHMGKECHYFSKDDLYVGNSDRYRQLQFPNYLGEVYLCEASQSYLSLQDVPSRIRNTLADDVRFIIILRNPVDRAASAFRYFRTKQGGEVTRRISQIVPPNLDEVGLDDLLEWEQAETRRGLTSGAIVERDPSWSPTGFPFCYFQISAYSLHIGRFLDLFPRESFLFLTFDQVTSQQCETIARIWNFLGLEAIPNDRGTRIHANETIAYRGERLGRVVLGMKSSLRPLKGVLPGYLRDSIRSFEKRLFMERLQVDFDPRVREQLLRIYAPDIERTSAMTGLDLSAWQPGAAAMSDSCRAG